MKKLMTMMSAVAVALGLQAIGMAETGTSFEGIVIPEGDKVAYDIFTRTGELTAQSEGQTYWVTNETATLEVVNGFSSDRSRPAQYEEADQNRYLSIKTTLGHPVGRNVNVGGSGTEISTGYYFDSLVKFTAFDSEDSVTNSWNASDGAKLAIWLKENEGDGSVPPSTNLMITAGYLVNDDVVVTNYECVVVGENVNINDGGWHRVSVRAINNIYGSAPYVPGFIVYVDTKYVAVVRGAPNASRGIDEGRLNSEFYGFNADNAIFPSAIQGGDFKTVIRSVDFDGQGDVDDIVFTSTMPKFMEEETAEVFAVKLGNGVESVTLTAYKEGEGSEVLTNGTFYSNLILKYASGLSVVIGENDVSYLPNYMEDGIVTNGNVTVQGNEYVPEEGNTGIEIKAKPFGAMVVIGSETNKFETVVEAFDHVTAEGGSGTITMNAASVGDTLILDNGDATIVLDLAGNSIVNTEGAAIVLNAGNLTITNSSNEASHIATDSEYSIPAVVINGGSLTIAGGNYDSTIQNGGEDPYTITGGAFLIAAFTGLEGELRAAVARGYKMEAINEYYVPVVVSGWTVTFYGFNGVELGSVNVEDGETLTTVPDFPTVPGYTASGWLLNDEAFNLETPVESDLDLYANYEADTYTITYNLDLAGATNATACVEDFTVEDAVTLLPAGCVGYTFEGWTNSEGQVIGGWDAGDMTDDVTLYAWWTADSYTITYLNDDGTTFNRWADNFAARASYTVEDAVTLPVAGDLKLGVGVTFQGWTNETGTVDGWAAGEKTGPVTVYAKLEAVVSTPTIDPEAGTTTVEVEAESAAGAIAQVKIVAPEASGIDTPEEQAAYEALFDITAEPILGSDGKWEVTIALKDSVVTGVNTDALAVFSGDTSVAIPQGLYYRVTPSTSLPIASSGAGTLSTGTPIVVTKPGTTQGFLKVELSASPIAAPAAN